MHKLAFANTTRSNIASWPFLLIALFTLGSCDGGSELPVQVSQSRKAGAETANGNGDFAERRRQMVAEQLASRDITNERVLDAMRQVPRHQFVPKEMREAAYRDSPLPIGSGQTISQPYIVALMTQLAQPDPSDKALDVGTGSGYQAAVLAELVDEVFTVEIVESLAKEASERLEELEYENVEIRHGDGYKGWKGEAPFDVIILAAASDHIPPALQDQLAPGGRMVLPVGDDFQTLMLVERDEEGKITRKNIAPVRFVPMTGEAEKPRD